MSSTRDQDLLTVRLNAVSAEIGARAAEKVEPLGLDQRMIDVLFAVEALNRPSQQAIALHTGIDRTTVSKTIDRLESEGLAGRSIDPGHRRRNWIELTPKARRTIARVRDALRECDDEFMSTLNQAEQQELARLLDKLQ